MVVGIDEVGRGAWAGPMVLGAVGFVDLEVETFDRFVKRKARVWRVSDEVVVGDSKVLSIRERERAAEWIHSKGIVRIEEVMAGMIDEKGLSWGWNNAVKRLVEGFDVHEHEVYLDGNWEVGDCVSVVKGEQEVFEIACASIAAKVYRDALMCELAKEHAGYGWERNVGYGTAAHREGILNLGVCDHHRKSWVSSWLSAQGAVGN